jgi:hypothetical protein
VSIAEGRCEFASKLRSYIQAVGGVGWCRERKINSQPPLFNGRLSADVLGEFGHFRT